MNTATGNQGSDPGTVRRLDAVMGGPVWWACHLAASYWLVPRACRWGTQWPLHVVTVVLLALIGRALVSAAQVLRAGRDDVDGGRRDLFIGWVGVALSCLFAAVTVAEWLPTLQLHPCW